jgi:hypothetical protein
MVSFLDGWMDVAIKGNERSGMARKGKERKDAEEGRQRFRDFSVVPP